MPGGPSIVQEVAAHLPAIDKGFPGRIRGADIVCSAKLGLQRSGAKWSEGGER